MLKLQSAGPYDQHVDDLRYAGIAFTRVEYFIHDVFGNIYYLLLESFKCNIGKIANWFSKRVRKRQEKS